MRHAFPLSPLHDASIFTASLATTLAASKSRSPPPMAIHIGGAPLQSIAVHGLASGCSNVKGSAYGWPRGECDGHIAHVGWLCRIAGSWSASMLVAALVSHEGTPMLWLGAGETRANPDGSGNDVQHPWNGIPGLEARNDEQANESGICIRAKKASTSRIASKYYWRWRDGRMKCSREWRNHIQIGMQDIEKCGWKRVFWRQPIANSVTSSTCKPCYFSTKTSTAVRTVDHTV